LSFNFPRTLFFYIGTALSQVISVLTSFLIIDKFTPDSFGQYSFFFSIASIFGSFATLKFELSIAISPSINEASHKTSLSIVTSILFNILFALFGLIFHLYKIDLFLLMVLSIGLTMSVNASFQQFFLYNEDHFLNGFIPLLFASSNFIFLFFVNSNSSFTILFSYVLSNLIQTLIYTLRLKYLKLSFSRLFNFNLIKVFKDNRIYPVLVFPSSIIGILFTYLNPILLEYLYSKEEVGLFSFGIRILMIPSIVVGAVASSIYRVRIAKLFYDRNFLQIRRITLLLFFLLLIVTTIGFPILVFIVKKLHLFIDMHQWEGVIKILIQLVPFAISQLFFLAFSNVALVFNENKLLLWLNLLQFIFLIFSYFIGFYLGLDFKSFLTVFSLTNSFVITYSCYKFFNILYSKKL